jgi:5-methylcytosine-specific restriction endonuclease McrA
MTIMNQSAVLLLNASFEPIKRITVRAAAELILRDVVVAVEGVAAKVRSPSTTLEIPSVLRLRVYQNVPRLGQQWSRHGVLKRDDYTCIFCGLTVGDERLTRADLTIDHVIPVSRGGKSNWTNTACACDRCNNRKADRTPNEAGMRMRWEPRRPRTNYLIASGDVPREWKKHIEL